MKEQGLEGLVAKRRDSKYEPGERSGAEVKMRVNRTREFVIGGYTVGGRHFDALIFGYWEGGKLMMPLGPGAGSPRPRRSNCTGGSEDWRRRSVRSRICRRHAPGGGEGFTAAKMKDCRWLKPVLVGQFEFVEWTPDKHLRHSPFVGLGKERNTLLPSSI